jgi:YihY family inner membrane protein
MGRVLRRIDAMQRRHRGVAFPFAVLKKFSEDQSGNLAVLITYYAFFSIFPLLFALSEALGLVLKNNPSVQRSIESYATKNLPPAFQSFVAPTHGSVIVVIVTGVLALYSGLGVAKTAQTAWDTVYLVSRTDQPGFLPKTLRALRLIVVGGVGLVVTTAVSGAATSGVNLGFSTGPAFRVLGIVVALALNALLFTVLFRWLTVRPVSFRDALPGGIIAAVAFEVLQSVAAAFLNHKLKSSSQTYGSFATVIVLLSWFYLQSQMVLLAAQVNVVRQYHLWPRALTDAPSTEADFRAYEAYAERERFQPHEDVNTSYTGTDAAHDDAGRHAPAQTERT